MVLLKLLSSAIGLMLLLAAQATAHEVVPSIADLEEREGRLTFTVRLNIEGLVAGIDLSAVDDTNLAPQAADYDQLRALDPEALAEKFRAFWPEMARNIIIEADGSRTGAPELGTVEVSETGNVDIVRSSRIVFNIDLPAGTRTVRAGWPAAYGDLVVRQMGVDKPYDGYLEGGALSAPIKLSGGGQPGALATFLRYCAVGFDHIIPKGLDHVLFVLGLFFLSAGFRALFWQVTAFTLAHTVTLALSALGLIAVPASIVEPIIALSIVYVAVENMLSDRLMRWRPVVVFGFGLLHGLGFASVLGQFGLPDASFVAALIGFNVGVEIGQLTVIAAGFVLVGYWFGSKDWYRAAIAIPASALIAMTGAYWFIERTLL